MESGKDLEAGSSSSLAFANGTRYNLNKPDGVPASRNLAQFTAENASQFALNGGNNTCRIPVSSQQFLDIKNSVLTFDLTCKSAVSEMVLDGGAACVLDRVRILQGGREIERIDSYNLCHCVLNQYASNVSDMVVQRAQEGAPGYVLTGSKEPSQTFGTGESPPTNSMTLADGTTLTGASIVGLTVANVAGGKGYSCKQADQLEKDVKRTYSFGLKCGWFNPATAKMLPPNVGWSLELTFSPAANCFQTLDATPNYIVENVMLEVPQVMITDPASMARLNARIAQGVSWKATTFSHHSTTVTQGAGSKNLSIGEKARRLKGLFTVFRILADVTDENKYKLSNRTVQLIDNYYYQIGSSQYPQQQVNLVCDPAKPSGGTAIPLRLGIGSNSGMNVSQAYNECLRLFKGINNMGSIQISMENYAQSVLNTAQGLIAIDLQAYSDNSLSSGIDTVSNNLAVNLKCVTNTVQGAIDYQADTYGVAEIIFHVDENGQLFSEQ